MGRKRNPNKIPQSERDRVYRKSQKSKGYVKRYFWIAIDKAEELKKIVKNLNSSSSVVKEL